MHTISEWSSNNQKKMLVLILELCCANEFAFTTYTIEKTTKEAGRGEERRGEIY
jgi:hypothetical protein